MRLIWLMDSNHEGSHWEYKHDERLVAAIQIEAAGQAHFYLDVRQISAR